MLVFLLTGLQLSGKSSHAYQLKNKLSIPVLETGNAVYYEIEKRGLEANHYNISNLVTECLSEDPLFFIKNVIAHYKKRYSHTDRLIISGIKSQHEFDYVKSLFGEENVILIAFHASQKTRFSRVKVKNIDRVITTEFRDRKKREDRDLAIWQNFVERDKREINLGIGRLIATANILVNTENICWPYFDFNKSFKYLYEEIKRYLEQ